MGTISVEWAFLFALVWGWYCFWLGYWAAKAEGERNHG